MSEHNGFKRFMILNFSQAVSLIGSGLTDFALSFYLLQDVMKHGGNLSLYTFLYFMIYVPGILVAPFIGTIVDRYNKKVILITSDTIAAIGSAILLGLYVTGTLNIGLIYVIVFIKSVASAFQVPTFQSSISLLVNEKDYGRAVGFAQLGASINRIISPLLAGMLFNYASLEAIVVIDLVCYAFALSLISFFKMPYVKKSIESSRFLEECQLGFRILIKDRLLINLLFLFMFNNFFISFIEILVQPLVYVLNEQSGMLISHSIALGVVMTCGGIGMIVSSLIIGIKGVPKNCVKTILILNGLGGLILMLVLVIRSVPIFALGTLVYFLTIPFILSANITLWQVRVPVEHQGKVFSLRRACVLGIIPLSSLFAGGLIDWMTHSYDHLTFLHRVIQGPEGIYNFLFFVIGLITLLTSVIFVFNRYFKAYNKNWEGELENG